MISLSGTRTTAKGKYLSVRYNNSGLAYRYDGGVMAYIHLCHERQVRKCHVLWTSQSAFAKGQSKDMSDMPTTTLKSMRKLLTCYLKEKNTWWINDADSHRAEFI